MNEAEAKAWCAKHRAILQRILAMAHPLQQALHDEGAEMVALILTSDDHGAFVTPVNIGGRRAIALANRLHDDGISRTEVEAFVNVAMLVNFVEGLELLASLRERAIEIQRTCKSYTGYFANEANKEGEN